MHRLLIPCVVVIVGCVPVGPTEAGDAGVDVADDAGVRVDGCTGLAPDDDRAPSTSCGFDGQRCSPGCGLVRGNRLDENCCETSETRALDCVPAPAGAARVCVIDPGSGSAFMTNTGPSLEWPRCSNEVLERLSAELCTGPPE